MDMRSKPNRNQKAFTIVELLIVIVVIAILAAISIVAYSGIQERARVTALMTALKQTEDGFKTYMILEGLAEYPRDTAFGKNNPLFSEMAAYNSAFAESVPTARTSAATWTYDNDKDTRVLSSCITAAASDWSAVSIVVAGLTPSLALALDREMDDGDLLCGKIRQATVDRTQVSYKLSFDQLY